MFTMISGGFGRGVLGNTGMRLLLGLTVVKS